MSAPFLSVWEGFIIMVISILIGLMMSFAGGIVLDNMIAGVEGSGAWDVADEWDPRGGISFLSNLYMLLMYAIPIMGILSFAVTVFWRQEYDEYQYIPRQ